MAGNQNGKPTTSPTNHDQNVGQREDNPGKSGLAGDGNKKHGDDLEEIIPKGGARATPEAGGRPTRADGDNDDLGDPGSPASGSKRGYPNRS